MKRFLFLLAVAGMTGGMSLHAQDAATEERLNKLTGQIDDLIAGQKAQQKQINELSRDLERMREQLSKPTASYASPEDLKRVADAVLQVDRKRMEDNDKIHSELVGLRKILEAPAKPPKKAPGSPEKAEADKPAKDEKGYPYTIQKGDTLSIIVQAYRDKNIKITTEQILKANPGLKAERLKPGQQIWIPAPTP